MRNLASGSCSIRRVQSTTIIASGIASSRRLAVHAVHQRLIARGPAGGPGLRCAHPGYGTYCPGREEPMTEIRMGAQGYIEAGEDHGRYIWGQDELARTGGLLIFLLEL